MNLRRLICTLILLTLLPAIAQVPVSGTDVVIQPPPGYQSATTFTGFQNVEEGWFITVVQAPISVPELLARMTDEALAEKGMQVQAREQADTADGIATLVRVTQSQGGTDYEKLIVIVGKDGRTAAVTGGYPVSLSDSLRKPMTESLLTARMEGPSEAVDPEGLPYAYQEIAELQSIRRISQTVVFSPPESLLSAASGPIFLGMSLLNAPQVADPETLVRAELKTVYLDVAFSEPEVLDLDGYRAFEYVGTGTDRKSGSVAALYFLLLTDPETGKYFAAFGQMPPDQKDTWLPRFQTVGRSLRPR